MDPFTVPHHQQQQVTKKVQTISGETQLRRFGTFLDAHRLQLDSMLAADDRHNYHRCTGKPDATVCAPITVDYDMRHEQLTLFQLANTNNNVLNKIVCVFTQLGLETRHLCDQAAAQQLRFLHVDERLLLCPTTTTPNAPATERTQQQLIVSLSEQLEFLTQIQYLMQRCLVVSVSIFRQLAAFFADSRSIVSKQNITNNNNSNSLKSVQLQLVFGYLADLATVAMTFDRLLSTSNIQQNWSLLSKSIDSLHDNIGQFTDTYNEPEVSGLRNLIVELEQMLAGDLFQVLVDGLYAVAMNFDATTLAAFIHHFTAYLRTQFSKIERFDAIALNDFTDSQALIKCTVMCALGHNVFGADVAGQFFVRAYEINSKYCGIALIENVPWLPDEFIGRYVRQAEKSPANRAQLKYVADATKTRMECLKKKFSEYRVTCATQKMCLRAFVWMMKVREAQQSDRYDINVNNLLHRCSLILDGIQLMGEISYLVRSVTMLHIHLNVMMPKCTLASVCRLLEQYKIVKCCYEEHLNFFIDSQYIVCQHLCYQALSIIQITMKKFSNRGTGTGQTAIYDERNIDIVSALQLSELCLLGPSTPVRVLTARLALSISDPMKILSPDHLERLGKVLGMLESLINFRTTLGRNMDTKYMHWHQTILPIYLKQSAVSSTGEMSKYWNIFHSEKSTVNFLAKIGETTEWPVDDNSSLAPIYITIDSNKLMRSTLLARICSHIENNLRLFIHSYMHDGSTASGGGGGDGVVANETTALISAKPLQFNGGHWFVFKNNIEHYLNKTFYNLTAVSLSDGRTYSEMRSFAKIKYDLNLIDDQLPSETLEQGLDLLDVMRFINDFTSKFVYDMNNQVFIQAISGNNFLNTVTVGHIVNSLRTHGIGIMNTAINCGYKLLCQKMPLLSKYLYTDQVKSALGRVHRHAEESKERNKEMMFSYELAKNFAKNMFRLNVKFSFADYLAILTQIGNIMGYVRLIRSAGIKYVSNAGIFLPLDATGGPLVDMAANQRMSEVTCEAAWNLKINIANLSKDFVTKPNYFRSFMAAFTDIMRDSKNAHLRLFYVTVPSLTILFVDRIVQSKENKHNKTRDANDWHVFTDDGFAMGLAYVLMILNQVDAFCALDWFGSVSGKYATEMAELQLKLGQLTTSYEDEKLRQTLLLTHKRIQTFADEFEMLRCNLSSAIRYFQ